jgi:hypothetical protein
VRRSLDPVLAVLFVLSLSLITLAGVAFTEVAPQAPHATTAPNCVTSRINASSDDVEERDDTGAVDLDGDSAAHPLQMYRLYSGSSTSSLNWWGLRFLNVNVPQGATITSATVTFRASATSVSTPSGMTLWGQLAVTPVTFAASLNNITSRTRTTATAAWSVPQWTSGSDYVTPSLAAIVQEIVDQSGWTANNALVIMGQTTVMQNRRAISHDSANGATLAPLLEVCYTQAPTVTTSASSLPAFGTRPGVASAAQTYTVSGSNLTGNVTITPPADFELSTTSGSGFGTSPLTLTPTSGSVPATTIYVRFNRATVGTSSGNITHTSSGAATKSVAVSGMASTANHAPNPPALVQPADSATDFSTSPTLKVTVTDPDSDPMNVSFYGRAAGETAGEDFTLIALPDTQNYSTAYPVVFNSQTQWIANNKTAQNIVFVTHLGDIVNIANSTTRAIQFARVIPISASAAQGWAA